MADRCLRRFIPWDCGGTGLEASKGFQSIYSDYNHSANSTCTASKLCTIPKSERESVYTRTNKYIKFCCSCFLSNGNYFSALKFSDYTKKLGMILSLKVTVNRLKRCNQASQHASPANGKINYFTWYPIAEHTSDKKFLIDEISDHVWCKICNGLETSLLQSKKEAARLYFITFPKPDPKNLEFNWQN